MKKKGKIAITIAGIVLFALLGGYTYLRAKEGSSDFAIQYRIASALFAGENPYTKFLNNRYPVFLFLLIAPLSRLSLPTAVIIWYLLNLALFAWSYYLLINSLPQETPGGKPIWKILPLILILGILADNLYLGQMNILLLFLIGLTLLLHQRGKEFAAGFTLALGIALKLTPLLLLLYFIYRRRVKLTLATIISLIILLSLLPIPFLGWERNFELLSSFYQQVIKPTVSGGIGYSIGAYRHTNQSLAAFLFRLLARTPADTISGKTVYANIADLSEETISLIIKIADLIIIVLLAIFLRQRTSLKEGAFIPFFEYSLIVMAMLLISPISWISHFILLTIPYIVGSWYALKLKGRMGSLILSSLFTCFLLSSLGVSRRLQSYSPLFLGTIILFSSFLFVLIRERKLQSEEQAR